MTEEDYIPHDQWLAELKAAIQEKCIQLVDFDEKITYGGTIRTEFLFLSVKPKNGSPGIDIPFLSPFMERDRLRIDSLSTSIADSLNTQV